jgi:hypothetical protein
VARFHGKRPWIAHAPAISASGGGANIGPARARPTLVFGPTTTGSPHTGQWLFARSPGERFQLRIDQRATGPLCPRQSRRLTG